MTPAPGRRLVVTADDFGASVAVNQAIEQGFREGVLTAASLMVTGPAAGDAIRRAAALGGLGVGLHLVLVDGEPRLSGAQVSRLVDRSGRFRSNMAAAGLRFALSKVARQQLEAEITAQFHAFQETGLALDHVNAHKHFHLHPIVSDLVVSIGARFGARAIRAPSEPRRILNQIEADRWIPLWSIEALLSDRLRRRLRARGWTAPDQVFGLAWSGTMDEARLSGLIEALPPGLSEIYLHPTTESGETTGPGSARELAAVLSPRVRAAIRASGAQLGAFADFATRAEA